MPESFRRNTITRRMCRLQTFSQYYATAAKAGVILDHQRKLVSVLGFFFYHGFANPGYTFDLFILDDLVFLFEIKATCRESKEAGRRDDTQ